MIQPNDVCLVARGLVAYQYAIFNDVPFFGFHAFIIVANSAERMGLRFVANKIYNLTSKVKVFAFPFIQRKKRSAGIVGFVAQHAVQFGRMPHRFVNG